MFNQATANSINTTLGFPYGTKADSITTVNLPHFASKAGCEGVYEYIIYLLEEGEFELLEEGKIYANCEDGAREKVLFNFAKSEEGKNWDLEDLNIEVRLF